MRQAGGDTTRNPTYDVGKVEWVKGGFKGVNILSKVKNGLFYLFNFFITQPRLPFPQRYALPKPYKMDKK